MVTEEILSTVVIRRWHYYPRPAGEDIDDVTRQRESFEVGFHGYRQRSLGNLLRAVRFQDDYDRTVEIPV